MGLYSQFQTNEDLEKSGVVIDYGSFRVLIARAGGGNTDFMRVLAAKTKPHRRAIQTETMDPNLAQSIEKEVYAETVVRNWETLVDGEWVQGIESPNGGLLDVTKENIQETFENLPDLFYDLKDQANKVAIFRQAEMEADTKN